MKKLSPTTQTKLKLSRETIALVTRADLAYVEGGGSLTQTKGVGCEPSGIRPCSA